MAVPFSSSSASGSASSGAPVTANTAGTTSGPALFPMGSHEGRPFIRLKRPVYMIGSRSNAPIHLKSSTVSKAHALLIQTRHATYLRDLESREKTFVNGQPIKETQLRDGDMIAIGRFTFRYQAAKRPPLEQEPPAMPAALPVSGSTIPVPIESRVVLIGRRPTCDIPLTEASVSTAHAAIFQWEGKRFLRDLGSRSGTFVNGHKIEEVELHDGDVIHVGETDITYSSAAAEAAAAAMAGGIIADAPEVDELGDIVDLGAVPEIEAEAPAASLAAPPPSLSVRGRARKGWAAEARPGDCACLHVAATAT